MTIDNTLKAFFDLQPHPTCIIDGSGQVLAWNLSLQKLTQLAPEQAIGKKLETLGELPQGFFSYWQNPLSNKLIAGKEIYTLAILPLGENWAIWVEEHQIQSEQNDLLNTVAHDLQNPLAAIKGYSELVLTLGGLKDQQIHYLKRVVQAVADMGELVGRLLDVAWIDSGMKPQLSTVNLAHLANDISAGYAERAKKQSVNLRLDLERVPPALADERRLKQVLHNLIGNAVKYSPNGGEVVVLVCQEGQNVKFEVRDQGIGIPADFLDKIFGRFIRVPTDYDIEGNGLGLAISWEILHKHGAKLEVESTLGVGSRFYFLLPLANL